MRTEETALSTVTEQSLELKQSGAIAEAQFDIQSAIIIARRFPRNEDAAFEKLMRACKRTSFAEDAAYEFPRGGSKVTGPSVNLAREAARVWGNVRYGLDILRDEEETRHIRGWAYDVETNVKVTAEDDFAKLVQRKGGQWVKPDERDLRELTNRRGAILVRNCILQILPKDLIEDAQSMAAQTLRASAEQDPDAARRRIILAFSEINITPEMLEKKLGHPIATCSPAEIAELRAVYKSIADGNSTWAEYSSEGNGARAEREKGALNLDQLKKPAEAPPVDKTTGEILAPEGPKNEVRKSAAKPASIEDLRGRNPKPTEAAGPGAPQGNPGKPSAKPLVPGTVEESFLKSDDIDWN